MNVRIVLSKRQLLERVWGFDEYDGKVVEAHIWALRRKLEGVGPRLIQTVRGFGYAPRQERAAEHPRDQTMYARTGNVHSPNGRSAG